MSSLKLQTLIKATSKLFFKIPHLRIMPMEFSPDIAIGSQQFTFFIKVIAERGS